MIRFGQFRDPVLGRYILWMGLIGFLSVLYTEVVTQLHLLKSNTIIKCHRWQSVLLSTPQQIWLSLSIKGHTRIPCFLILGFLKIKPFYTYARLFKIIWLIRYFVILKFKWFVMHNLLSRSTRNYVWRHMRPRAR